MEPNFTPDQVAEHARKLYPKASPAWIAKLVNFLANITPQLLALFMNKTPPTFAVTPGTIIPHESYVTAKALAQFAALVDATSPPSSGEPHVFQGPIVDPFYRAVQDQVNSVISVQGPKLLAYIESFAEHWVSANTP